MHLYKPVTKTDGRANRADNRHINPYYGQHGAAWVKNGNASLYNAEHEHSQAKLHLQHRFGKAMYNVLWAVIAIILMLVGGLIIYSLAINF
ncbi:hypothetical protein [Lactiplantibacillus mudanjiangensis]|uniref:Uncharacterized protein n=1 Tax=Lactiplantibacillus mudanjiangensis TaxID=1296538 RepID=A0A660E541_9LACO|nr:hypothetical protein [Lactiplantibacillus mudanjiangensis]VDG19110.1 hypothetical protein [Lactobacillus sp. CBA3605] [Lactiplantibacillus mudanjiangensis]VDG23189.1 hypothetical protein [Lactobacillus sp. CBA3605] [Lactiplantibacillus mudanjiangensis]VDG29884.1 hypothetical protein [Lactobacillus sp. CBA3605] [Lactiplantibacillus mudanjiangensis]VDG33183.1 hypothetical protein [Lactobacillus sp. CBA3605] [Lactiplantibacillus mudanjiangensis]